MSGMSAIRTRFENPVAMGATAVSMVAGGFPARGASIDQHFSCSRARYPGPASFDLAILPDICAEKQTSHRLLNISPDRRAWSNPRPPPRPNPAISRITRPHSFDVTPQWLLLSRTCLRPIGATLAADHSNPMESPPRPCSLRAAATNVCKPAETNTLCTY